MKTTRNSLLVSGLSLVLSVAILMGATFAWFTDSVSNSGNVIQSGELDISATVHPLAKVASGESETEVMMEAINWNVDTALMDVEAPYRPASLGTYCALGFADGQDLEADDVHFFDETNFEPGKSYAKLLRVTNNGSLAAKVTLSLSITEDGLTDALWFAVYTDSPVIKDRTPMSDFNTAMADVALQLGPKDSGRESADFLIAYGMNEEAGNDFQNKQFAADLNVLATQAPYEADGFHSTQYDAAANGVPDHEDDWSAAGGSASASKPGTGWAAITTLSVSGASVDVPAGAIAEGSDEIELSVVPTTKPDGVTVTSTQTSVAYDISVTGLKDGNTEPISVKLYVGTGLANVKVYHNSDEVTGASYDSATGYVTFTTTSFSPFTVVYQDGNTYVSNAEELKAALENGGTYVFRNDIELDERVNVVGETEVVLDLNGKTLNYVAAGTAGSFGVWGTSDLTMKNGTIHMPNAPYYGLYVKDSAKLTLSGITADSTDALVFGAGQETIVIEDCVLTTSYPIYHNGSTAPCSMTITGSTITGGVYVSNSAGRELQTLVIDDSTIIGSTAVEFKHTKATITNSTLVGTAVPTGSGSNNNGSCTAGYAVAVTTNGVDDLVTGTVKVENCKVYNGSVGAEENGYYFVYQVAKGASVTIDGETVSNYNTYGDQASNR